MKRAGFSLLEVILALAVLAGAIAMLGEAASMALRNAQYTRDTSRAQALCESTLDQVIAGFIPSDPSDATPVESSDTDMDPNAPAWVYSIEQQEVDDEPGLLSIRVTVTRDLPPEQRPVTFALSRWIADPSYAASQSDSGSQSGSSGMTSVGGSQ
jgi:general secretion pathway protein I